MFSGLDPTLGCVSRSTRRAGRRPSMRPRRWLSWRAVSWMCVRGVPRYATAILASDETSPSLTRCSMNNPAHMTPSNRIRLFYRRSSPLD